MNKLKLTALLLGSLLCFGTLGACENKKNDDSSSSASESVDDDNVEDETEEFDSDGYTDKIMESINKAEVSDEPLTYGKIGELVTPADDDDDADLGAYRECDDGVKLYFNEDEFPEELMLTLKTYFQAFGDADYTTYTRCVYPEYIEKMDEYLKKEFEYDLKTSFAAQCTNLASNVNGGFDVTRLKMDVPEQYEEGKENAEAYFESFSDILGDNYYEKLKKEVDNIYDGEFYVIVRGEEGTENLIVSAYEIIFAEKDGRYYVFG